MREEEYSRTPLIWAEKNGHTSIVRFLVEKGVDIKAKEEEYGRTPLS